MTAIPSRSTKASAKPETPSARPVPNDLFERLPVPALRTGADGRIWRVNPLAARILGSAIALEGTPIGLILPGLELAATGTGPVTWSGLLPAPEPRWVEVSADRVASADGDRSPNDWILVLRDVTETVAKRELFDDILALLAHELRTPLATIRGFSENLLDSIEGPVNERQRDVLNRMIRTSRRSIRLLENVLESARCRTGHATLESSEFRIDHLVRDAAESLRPSAAEKGVAIHTEADESLPPVTCDADKVEQVVLNLLTNSIKNTPRHGSIRLRVSRPDAGVASIVQSLGAGDGFDSGRFLQVTVEDTGVGIPPEDLERIFERFTRARTSNESALTSFGLGLWICRDIVNQLGGRICIQSELNVGTRVSFLIPLRVETPAAARGEETRR